MSISRAKGLMFQERLCTIKLLISMKKLKIGLRWVYCSDVCWSVHFGFICDRRYGSGGSGFQLVVIKFVFCLQRWCQLTALITKLLLLHPNALCTCKSHYNYLGPYSSLIMTTPSRFTGVYLSFCRSPWPRGRRYGCASARLLGLWVRIPLGTSVCCECCVLSGRVLCVGLITCPEESCRVLGVWVWWKKLIEGTKPIRAVEEWGSTLLFCSLVPFGSKCAWILSWTTWYPKVRALDWPQSRSGPSCEG